MAVAGAFDRFEVRLIESIVCDPEWRREEFMAVKTLK